jgi:hypothetical protein
MKKKVMVLTLVAALLLICCATAATLNVSVEEQGTNYIKWNWTEDGITALNIDGKLVSSFDPNSHSYILSNLNSNELHSITIYKGTDSGTSQTYTTYGTEYGVWGYALLALIFLIVGYYYFAAVCFIGAMVAFIGLYELVSRSDWSMVSGTTALIAGIYLFLIIVCCLTWGFRSGRIGR